MFHCQVRCGAAAAAGLGAVVAMLSPLAHAWANQTSSGHAPSPPRIALGLMPGLRALRAGRNRRLSLPVG